MKKKLSVLLAAVLCLSLLLAGCGGGGSTSSQGGGGGGSQDGQIELTFSWWGSDNRHEAIEEVIALYEAKNPGVKINVEYGAWDGWQSKIMTQLSGNTEADIIQVNYNWVHSFGMGENVFYNLNDLSEHIDLSNWDQEYLDAMTVNGELAAVPHGMNGRVMLYNKALFADAGLPFPSTYEDLYNAAAVIAADNTPTGAENKYVMLLLDPSTPDLFLAQMLYNQTGKIMQVDGKIQYTVEEVAQALEEYQRMAEAGVMPTFQQEDPMNNESNPVWTSGRSGAIYEWTNSMDKYLLSYKGGGFADEIAAAPYIVPDSSVTPTIYVKPNLGYAISKNCKNPEIAADFLNFFFTDEEAVKALGTSIGVSSNKVTYAIQESESMLTDIMVEGYAMLNSYNQIVMDPYFEDSNVRGERYTAVEAFRSGQSSAQDAAQAYIDRQQAELDKFYQ